MKAGDRYFSDGLAHQSDRSFIDAGLAHESVANTGHHIATHSLVRSADRSSQDKKLVGLLDRFAKTAGSRNSILTLVYPYN